MTHPPLARPSAPPAPPESAPAGGSGTAAIDLRHLIPAGSSAVTIDHEGQRYTLRVTRANKLILTK